MRTQIHLARDDCYPHVKSAQLIMAVSNIWQRPEYLSPATQLSLRTGERPRLAASVLQSSSSTSEERELRDFPRPREREMFYCLILLSDGQCTVQSVHCASLPGRCAFKSAFLADSCGSVANDRFSFIWRNFAHLYDDIFINLASKAMRICYIIHL